MRAQTAFNFIFSLGIILALALVMNTSVLVSKAEAKYNPRYASIVIDADTGEVIRARYADKVLYPASLTKIMTLLLVFEAIENGEVRLRDRIQISRHAASMVPSKLNLPVGSSIKVEDAIKALVTKSANDVAVAIAEHIGGTESNFAYLMTQKARHIGMRNTRFKNASGLHNRSQVSTARDMSKLARYVIKYYPHYYAYFSTQKFSYRGSTYVNHNRLMRTYEGMDGMKTGYIGASGFNLVASAVRNNRRLIGVVFGGRTSRTRNAHMEAILNAGFDRLKTMRVAQHKIAPLPDKKPNQQILLASLEPQAGKIIIDAVKDVASLIGQGDVDPELVSRYETGLIAASAHTGKPKTMKDIGFYDFKKAAMKKPNRNAGESSESNWSIQVGAFNSRLASDRAIQKAQDDLPYQLASNAKPLILPARVNGSSHVVFRARLGGLDHKTALESCRALKECMIIAPGS